MEDEWEITLFSSDGEDYYENTYIVPESLYHIIIGMQKQIQDLAENATMLNLLLDSYDGARMN